jgi:hypothetical protein
VLGRCVCRAGFDTATALNAWHLHLRCFNTMLPLFDAATEAQLLAESDSLSLSY